MNELSKDKFGYEADGSWFEFETKQTHGPAINFPPEIRQEAEKLGELHDKFLNWEDPREESPDWTPELQKEFDERSEKLLFKIRDYLGDEFEIYNGHDQKNWH